MSSRAGLFFGLLTACLAGGCGTAVNTFSIDLNVPGRSTTPTEVDTSNTLDSHGGIGPLWTVSEQDRKQIYGGVLVDLEILWGARSGKPHHDIDPWLGIIDMPFSAIGDTITLPYILMYQSELSDKKTKVDSLDSHPLPTAETVAPVVEPSK